MPVGATSLARELPIVLGGIGLFYSVIAFARYWSGPVSSQAEISLHLTALPKYALFSVLRIAIAYIFSFLFTLVYGYVAAYNRKAERFMIPLLDTLQSIPVLSFLPGVMISMAALFPSRQLGVELGSVLLIFTGQVWNMTFSFYSSLKSIPTEMREAAHGVSVELVAAILATRVAAGGDRTDLEFDDVGGRRLVLPDGLRNVCSGQPRLSSARPWLLSADRRQRGKHARDLLGFD